MGTFIKYLIYITLFVIAVLIIKNLWNNGLTSSPVVTETVVTVTPTPNTPQTPPASPSKQ